MVPESGSTGFDEKWKDIKLFQSFPNELESIHKLKFGQIFGLLKFEPTTLAVIVDLSLLYGKKLLTMKHLWYFYKYLHQNYAEKIFDFRFGIQSYDKDKVADKVEHLSVQ